MKPNRYKSSYTIRQSAIKSSQMANQLFTRCVSDISFYECKFHFNSSEEPSLDFLCALPSLSIPDKLFKRYKVALLRERLGCFDR